MKKCMTILALIMVLGICGSCGGSFDKITTDERQTSTPSETQSISETASQPEIPVPVIDETDIEETPPEPAYILNTNSRRFHKPFCRSVEQMKPENYQETSASREEVLEMGYTPCGNCKP